MVAGAVEPVEEHKCAVCIFLIELQRAILGNDAAIQAYREGKLPFPDGAIIARLAWSYVPSEENNKVFGREQSFVAGPATNVQFMVKGSKKYAAARGMGVRSIHRG